MMFSNSTTVQSEATESWPSDYQDYDDEIVAYSIMTYIPPVLLIIGTIGNVLSFIVLQVKSFRNTPSGFTLSALAVVDTAALYSGMLSIWVGFIKPSAHYITSFTACIVDIFATYYFAQLSSWTLVLVTVERVVSVCLPFRAHILVTRRKMVISWITVTLGLAAVNMHFMFTMGVQQNNITTVAFPCQFREQYMYFGTRIVPWIDLTLLALAPLAVIISGNVAIVLRLCMNNRRRKLKMNVAASDGSTAITLTLVLVSLLFVLTTMPSTVIGILFRRGGQVLNYDENVIYFYTLLVYHVNNCINFYVYCLTGSKFREAFCEVFCCVCRRLKRHQNTEEGVTQASELDVL